MTSDGGTWGELVWGRGPKLMDWFLEPTCPHCGRAFGKLLPLLERAGEDRLTVRLTVHSQPWHLFSGVVSRAVLAATLTPEGRDAAYRVMAAVYEHREDYIATDHSSGPNMDAPPSTMLQRIADHCGLDLRAVFERKEAGDMLKRHIRFARQNGIHASPTFMVDGLVNDKLGSRDEVDTWLGELGLA
ncbi:DsbA family protein [Chelativorans salis]|uniref:DsbA family protein n=1 Tax=Chelativorans salis TaxID=2978478 RepID=A0ABT2LUC4_9HYPH|nr:DsbA family protein [Chelativorans sp. EGI FJ00035]MCT7378128.1 DsbA family protein [Chelativorans sp. EGI FJ00035]